MEEKTIRLPNISDVVCELIQVKVYAEGLSDDQLINIIMEFSEVLEFTHYTDECIHMYLSGNLLTNQARKHLENDYILTFSSHIDEDGRYGKMEFGVS